MNQGNKIFYTAAFGLSVALSAMFQTATAATLNFAIQPILSEAATLRTYQPLADFISKATGDKVVIHTARDFPEYWVNQKKNNPYQIMLDNAFFTDYRNEKKQWASLVKYPGLVSYTLIVMSDNAVFEASELVGKTIASLMPPAPSGVFLGQMFRNPLRQPYIVPTTSASESLEILIEGKVIGAILPTPMVNVALQNGADLVVVKTSVQIPFIALSVSPDVSKEKAEQIKKALLDADKNDAGKALLKKLTIPNFEPADPSLYSGLMQYLLDFSFASE